LTLWHDTLFVRVTLAEQSGAAYAASEEGLPMKAIAVTLGIVLGFAVAPGFADADGRAHRFRGDFRGSRRFDGHNQGFGHRHGFVHRPLFPVFVGPFLDSSVILAPPVVYAPAPGYTVPPAYAPPPAYAAPAPQPMPRVVEFPNGRYELRGDGVYSPYNWVWVPNPPMAPPPPPPPTAPPAAAPEPPPARRPAALTAVLYRWTDEQGVTTWTDSLEKVPVRYRGRVNQLTP
jgi:uncharacterized protein DUF4124